MSATAEPGKPYGKPLVTVVIVDRNCGTMLDESLASVFAQTHEPIEVILVDNGSTDAAATRARDTYGDRLHYIRNEDNLGFATANNQAFEQARGEWIFLLNNDAVAAPDTIVALSRVADSNPDVGMLACRVVVYDQPHVFDSVGQPAECSETPASAESGEIFEPSRTACRRDARAMALLGLEWN